MKMSQTLSIYSPRHVLQLYMVPRSKLQLLFPGEIIKVATTYQFVICGRRDANACKRPALQTIQLKRRATGQGCGNFGLHLGRAVSFSPSRPINGGMRQQDQGQKDHWNNCSPRIESNPALHRKRPALGSTIFGGRFGFWTKPHSPVCSRCARLT